MADADGKAERRAGVRTTHLNVRFSDTGRWILREMQERYGLSQASVLEMLLREEARRHGFVIPGSGADKARREAMAKEAERLGITKATGSAEV